MKQYTTITRGNNYLRTLTVDGHEIQEIAIYSNGVELGRTNRAWFERSSYCGDSVEIKLYQVKRATKLNLNREDNFYIKEVGKYYSYKSGYTLYINANNFKHLSIYEDKYMDTKEYTNYINRIEATLQDDLYIKYQDYDFKNEKMLYIESQEIKDTIGCVTRTVKKQLGLDVETLRNNIQDIFGLNYVYVSEKELEKFNSMYQPK